VSFPVVHALEQLQQDGDEKARQYLAAILRFEFIITLVAAEHILKSTVHVSTFLQGVKYWYQVLCLVSAAIFM
jgi:hypothetical protein